MNKICLSHGCCNKSEIYCVDKKLVKISNVQNDWIFQLQFSPTIPC
jgi:hypothetical protein